MIFAALIPYGINCLNQSKKIPGSAEKCRTTVVPMTCKCERKVLLRLPSNVEIQDLWNIY